MNHRENPSEKTSGTPRSSRQALIHLGGKALPLAAAGFFYALAVLVASGNIDMMRSGKLNLLLGWVLAASLPKGLAEACKRTRLRRALPGWILGAAVMAALFPLLIRPLEGARPLLLEPPEAVAAVVAAQGKNFFPKRLVNIKGEVRQCVMVPVNYPIETALDAGPGSRITFGLGLGDGDKKADYELKVFLRGSSGSGVREIYRRSLANTPPRWEDIRIDVPGKGEPARGFLITMAYQGKDENPPLFYVSRIMVEPAKEPARPRNVAVILIDALRADHLSSYGYARPDTDPAVAGLWHDQGVKFSRAKTAVSWTSPATASLLTGLYPFEHGVRQYDNLVLLSKFTTIAELLREQGYHTAAVSMNMMITPNLNFGQGFDVFHDLGNKMFYWNADLIGAGRVRQWLSQKPPQPFFLYCHFINPHYPYSLPLWIKDPPVKLINQFMVMDALVSFPLDNLLMKLFPGPRAAAQTPGGNALENLYDGEIRRSDLAAAQVLAALDQGGFMDNTLVIVLADHGEGFMEHGQFLHGGSLYEEQIHIPLFIAGPGIEKPGSVISCPVSIVDVAPTIAEFAGVKDAPRMSGQSLWPLIKGEPCRERPLLAWLDNRAVNKPVQAAIMKGNEKLIRTQDGAKSSLELYDLAADPAETHNLADQDKELAAAMDQELDRLIEGKIRKEETSIDQAHRDRQDKILKSIGYLKNH